MKTTGNVSKVLFDIRVTLSYQCSRYRELTVYWLRGYKTFYMLNSVEHEILNAHKCTNIRKFSIFQAQISIQCYFPAHKC